MASSIVLDHELEIVLDNDNPPLNNIHALAINRAGLHSLAHTVREYEIACLQNDPGVRMVLGVAPDIVSCAFNWFSVTLVNYLRLVGLIELMNQNAWKSDALIDSENRRKIKSHCCSYAESIIPEVLNWRHKVAAHFAATDPFGDNLGTLEQSVMSSVSFGVPYYYVGRMKWVAGGEPAELSEWALTEVFERLAPRFWPELTIPLFPR